MKQVKRRIGTEQSATRSVILDTAEKLMLEQGYAAVSARQVAKVADLKHTLVHYYFPTTDDLFLAVYRRAAGQVQEHLEAALASPTPLRAFWEHTSNSSRTGLAIEFMALANHRKVIRDEIARHFELVRARHAEALAELLYPQIADPEVLPPLGLSVLVVGVARALVMEAGLGISSGHAQARAFVERLLRLHEKPRPKAKRKT